MINYGYVADYLDMVVSKHVWIRTWLMLTLCLNSMSVLYTSETARTKSTGFAWQCAIKRRIDFANVLHPSLSGGCPVQWIRYESYRHESAIYNFFLSFLGNFHAMLCFFHNVVQCYSGWHNQDIDQNKKHWVCMALRDDAQNRLQQPCYVPLCQMVVLCSVYGMSHTSMRQWVSFQKAFFSGNFHPMFFSFINVMKFYVGWPTRDINCNKKNWFFVALRDQAQNRLHQPCYIPLCQMIVLCGVYSLSHAEMSQFFSFIFSNGETFIQYVLFQNVIKCYSGWPNRDSD